MHGIDTCLYRWCRWLAPRERDPRLRSCPTFSGLQATRSGPTQGKLYTSPGPYSHSMGSWNREWSSHCCALHDDDASVLVLLTPSASHDAEPHSPHVVHESERLWCGTAPASLSPTELQQLQEKHSGVAKAAAEKEGGELSYFEVFTAMAFKHFQEQQVMIWEKTV